MIQHLTNDLIKELFHQLWYYGEPPKEGTWNYLTWLGHKVWKCPFDLWIYQELIYHVRPDTIIETGTGAGGTALYLASICDIAGKGQIITVDIEPDSNKPYHPKIEYLFGSSIDRYILDRIRRRANGKVMVFLDSDHNKDHVLQEMEIYGQMVTPGSYMIVEDTNINGNPVLPEWGDGPSEAIREYLAIHDDFEVDDIEQKMNLSFNPGGYLKKK